MSMSNNVPPKITVCMTAVQVGISAHLQLDLKQHGLVLFQRTPAAGLEAAWTGVAAQQLCAPMFRVKQSGRRWGHVLNPQHGVWHQ
jgi:hypothetical protein